MARFGLLRFAAVTHDPANATVPGASGTTRRGPAWIVGLAVVGLVAATLPPAAVPGLVLALVLGLSLPRFESRGLRAISRLAVVVAAVGCVVGLGRFAVSGAMLGIVESGHSAAAKSALYRLREVVIAEDVLRRMPRVDPDGDGVGGAALISSLMGAAPARAGASLETSLLNRAFHGIVPTDTGPAASVERYLVVVCLPKAGGGFTARPEDAVDEETAERRFVAYAWPSESAVGMGIAFFTDEHENIRMLEAAKGHDLPYVGAAHAPACDAALGADGLGWVPWKNKKPRERLPGER